ncbi:MAG: DUF1223 domain-containing protein [Parvibaculum sp.]
MSLRRATIFVRSAIAGLLLVVTTVASFIASAEARPVVVELFTSQGCSSCPKADAYLRELAAREDIIALSFNVDYWDYLGWKDTLASPAFTQRQRAYSRGLGLSGVYTPQMIVDGVVAGVGSHRDEIATAIAARAAKPLAVDMSFADNGDSLTLDVGAGPAPAKPATLWLVRYATEEKVEIRRGENRGREIAYAHAVRELTPIGMWNGAATRMTLPKSELLTRGYEGCVALLQAGDGGPILGAAQIDLSE